MAVLTSHLSDINDLNLCFVDPAALTSASPTQQSTPSVTSTTPTTTSTSSSGSSFSLSTPLTTPSSNSVTVSHSLSAYQTFKLIVT